MALPNIKDCENLCRTVWPTVIGTVGIESCVNGLHAMQVLERLKAEQGVKRRSTVRKSNLSTDLDNIKQVTAKAAVQWLEDYFGNNQSDRVLEPGYYPNICWSSLKMTTFQSLTWKTALEKIRYGETVSYGQLATLMDKPKAVRAVGTALKKNPIFLIIPCHRIVRSNGNAGNYSGGKMNDVKEYLIQHEKQQVA